MRQRTRKLVGTFGLVLFAGIYALVVMALFASRLAAASGAVSLAFYAAAGLLWVPPAMWIIAWMQRP